MIHDYYAECPTLPHPVFFGFPFLLGTVDSLFYLCGLHGIIRGVMGGAREGLAGAPAPPRKTKAPP